jgi:small-conductance mechanosensitive channel
MKKILIFFVLGIFFAALANYLVSNTSPFDLEKLQKFSIDQEISDNDWEKFDSEIKEILDKGLIFNYLSGNAYLVALLILGSLFCFFAVLHLIIDKLFFKEYFEPPSLFDAIRRGIFFCAALSLIVLMRLYAVRDNYYLFIIPLFFLLFDYVFTKYFKESILEKIKEINELQKKSKNKEDLTTKY